MVPVTGFCAAVVASLSQVTKRQIMISVSLLLFDGIECLIITNQNLKYGLRFQVTVFKIFIAYFSYLGPFPCKGELSETPVVITGSSPIPGQRLHEPLGH